MKNIGIALVCGFFALTSCTKEGPQGPQGPQGPPGVVNVEDISFTVNPRDWQTASSTDLFVQVSVPDITQDIVDNGMVVVYLENNGFEVALPSTSYSGNFSYTFQPSYIAGELDIDLVANQNIATPTTSYDFKIVIVSAQVRLANPNINWRDYNEVKAIDQ